MGSIFGATICIKPEQYTEFPFLKGLHDAASTPRKGACTLLVMQGTSGDGSVLLSNTRRKTFSLIKDTGDTYVGLAKDAVKAYLADPQKFTLPKSRNVGAETATKFITAFFGTKEVSEKARKAYCDPIKKCPKFDTKI